MSGFKWCGKKIPQLGGGALQVGRGVAEGGGEIDGRMGDGQQDIKILFQFRDFVQGYFTGQSNNRTAFLFCSGGDAIRGFSLQGLFVDTAFTGDNAVAAIKGRFKTGDLQKIFNAADQAGSQDAVEAACGATCSACTREG